MSFDWVQNCVKGLKELPVGLPTSRMEDWRYTDVRELFAGDWTVAVMPSSDGLVGLLPAVERHVVRVRFVNGFFAGVDGSVDGVQVDLVDGEAGRRLAVAGQDVFGDGEEAIVNLCGSVSSRVVRIQLSGCPSGSVIELIHFASDGHSSRVSGANVVLEAGPSVRASVVEKFSAADAIGDYLRLNNTQVRVAAGGRLEWLRYIDEGVESRHCGVFHSRVEEEADFRVFFKTLGGRVVRNSSSIVLLGERAKVGLHGVTVGSGSMHVDNTTLLDHRVGHCESRELFRGVFRDRSSGAFTGKVRVHKDAQKTNAYQQNNALMLSDAAEYNARPVLQIWADDVKCTHGATVGAIDEDALRYIRSRGISRSEAEVLLTQAFLAEVEAMFSQE